MRLKNDGDGEGKQASGVKFINKMLQKLESITPAACSNHFGYFYQCKQAVNELKDVSSHLHLDINFLLYRFHNG